MTDRARVLIGRSVALVGIGAALAGLLGALAIGWPELLIDEYVLHNGLLAIGFGLIVWLVLPRQPRNGSVWTSAWVAVFTGLFSLSLVSSFHLALGLGYTTRAQIMAATPSDLPTVEALVPMMASWLFVPFFLAMTVGVLLFPDGRPPSSRWRWVGWAAVGGVTLSSLGLLWVYRPSGIVPYGALSSIGDFFTNHPAVALGEAVALAALPLSMAGMVVKFRRSSGVERQQFRVVLWGAAVSLGLVLVALGMDLYAGIPSPIPFLLVTMVLVGSYGVAIAKYRLYDIDVIISRTIVYGTLAVFIAGVYVGLVVGIGYLLEAHDDPSPLLGIASTVLIAIVFQPLRRRLERLANRMVYGRRATPYEVLSTFSQRVAAVDPAVLTQIAQALVEGTTAEDAAIWMRRGEGNQLAARWPPGGPKPTSPLTHEPGPLLRMADVTHDEEKLGAVTLRLRPGQPFSPADAELLDQVASGLGLALRNLRLTDDLRVRLDQLRESRRRIVAVQDMTRRRLERDLHDGAQQRLVSLKIKLGIGASMAAKNGLDRIRQAFDDLGAEADVTIEAIRDFARGIYPPLLEAEGLGPAIVSRTRASPIPVTVQTAGLGRFPREVEATVYFCVFEAVQNAVRHSRARSILVSIDEADGVLTFQVRDDGVGFEVVDTPPGAGLTHLRDRIDALDGALEIASASGRGTAIRGAIPIRQPATVT